MGGGNSKKDRHRDQAVLPREQCRARAWDLQWICNSVHGVQKEHFRHPKTRLDWFDDQPLSLVIWMPVHLFQTNDDCMNSDLLT